MKVLILLSALFLSSFIYAAEGAAKAIIVRGKVIAVIDGKETPVKKGMWLPEGSKVKTQKKSFTKLLFIDKSSMNVGPNSEMKIDTFPKDDAGIITLIKGQIRSKVTKNYMDMKKKNKSKLFIKTKTAAMGVRGTDFLVSFNPQSRATSLITFEGAVAMAKLSGSIKSQKALERVVSSPSAVMVKRGQFSGTSSSQNSASPPVKISPKQIENLERNEVPGLTGKVSKTKTKVYKSIIPPGVDPEAFANDSNALDSTISSAVGSNVTVEVKKEVRKEISKSENYGNNTASGTNEISVNSEPSKRAGGLVDVTNGQYIEPSKDAAYDAVTKTFVADGAQSIDSNGQVTAVPTNKKPGRGIASIDGSTNTNSDIESGQTTGAQASATGEGSSPTQVFNLPPTINAPPPPRLDDIIRQNNDTRRTKAKFDITAP